MKTTDFAAPLDGTLRLGAALAGSGRRLVASPLMRGLLWSLAGRGALTQIGEATSSAFSWSARREETQASPERLPDSPSIEPPRALASDGRLDPPTVAPRPPIDSQRREDSQPNAAPRAWAGGGMERSSRMPIPAAALLRRTPASAETQLQSPSPSGPASPSTTARERLKANEAPRSGRESSNLALASRFLQPAIIMRSLHSPDDPARSRAAFPVAPVEAPPSERLPPRLLEPAHHEPRPLSEALAKEPSRSRESSGSVERGLPLRYSDRPATTGASELDAWLSAPLIRKQPADLGLLDGIEQALQRLVHQEVAKAMARPEPKPQTAPPRSEPSRFAVRDPENAPTPSNLARGVLGQLRALAEQDRFRSGRIG
jgi:hypothetical protein